MRKLLFPAYIPIALIGAPAGLPVSGADPSPIAEAAPGVVAPLAEPLHTALAARKLRTAERRARWEGRREREQRRERRAAQVAVPPQLESIAACESGGDPGAVSSTGQYRGKYQFSIQTWQAVGGSGDPAAAPEGEQDRRAAVLYAQSGSAQWPGCSQ